MGDRFTESEAIAGALVWLDSLGYATYGLLSIAPGGPHAQGSNKFARAGVAE